MIEEIQDTIVNWLQNQSPWDGLRWLVDIAFVSFLLYRAFFTLRGTRASQLALGMLIIWGVYDLASLFDIRIVSKVLGGFFSNIWIVFVILFQNEIRRALVRIGKRPWFRSIGPSSESEFLDEVVAAVNSLAQRRIGALIVIERDISLSESIQMGTVLDAAVTSELIYSVFIPSFENPMHDGALLIRDRRIWQAGAFLPLTASHKIDRSLGTRHRAAIGLSEETDALVIVVSEERGAVSICFAGNMIRHIDASLMKQVLHGLLHPRPPARGTFGQESTLRTTRPSMLASPADG